MELNPILITLFSFLPSLIAATRKTKNRKTLFVINGIVGVINIYMSFNMFDSIRSLGFEGVGIAAVLLFVGWLGCLIAAISSKKTTEESTKQNQKPTSANCFMQKIPEKYKKSLTLYIVPILLTAALFISYGPTNFDVIAVVATVAGLLVFGMHKLGIQEKFAYIATGILFVLDVVGTLANYTLLGNLSHATLLAIAFVSMYFLLIKREFKKHDLLKTAAITLVGLIVYHILLDYGYSLDRIYDYDEFYFSDLARMIGIFAIAASFFAMYKVSLFIVSWYKDKNQNKDYYGIVVGVGAVLGGVALNVVFYNLLRQLDFSSCGWLFMPKFNFWYIVLMMPLLYKLSQFICKYLKQAYTDKNYLNLLFIPGLILCGISIGMYMYANEASYKICSFEDNYKDVVCNCVKSRLNILEKFSYINTHSNNKLKNLMSQNPDIAAKITTCVTSQHVMEKMF